MSKQANINANQFGYAVDAAVRAASDMGHAVSIGVTSAMLEAAIAQQAARIAELMADQISYEQRIDELENRLSNRAMEHAQDLGALIEAQAERDQLRAELEQQRGVVVLPERNELRADSDIEDAWQRGWNACLDGVSRLNPPGELQKRVENALIYGTSHPEIYDLPSSPRKFRLGDPVRKTKGSQLSGRVVGFYSTEQTPDGYAVESFTEKGSVQIYPGSALEPCEEPGECVSVPRELATRLCHTDYYTHLMARRELRNQILAQQGKAVGDE